MRKSDRRQRDRNSTERKIRLEDRRDRETMRQKERDIDRRESRNIFWWSKTSPHEISTRQALSVKIPNNLKNLKQGVCYIDY